MTEAARSTEPARSAEPAGSIQPAGRSEPAVRRGEPRDALAVAELVHESAAAVLERFGGERDGSIRVLRAAYGRPGNTVSREIVWVAERDGAAAGAMTAFPAAELERRARRFLRILLVRTPPWTWRESIRLHRLGAELVPPPPAESLYVDSLATAPRERRRGAARALLAEAEREARRLRLPALALETALDNAPARALYEAAGFEAVAERAPRAGLPGFAGYVKPL
ncbi:MAG TPA: GNAT family N-acetyltransferase [Thermoleophilaceae bacterium]